MQLRIPRDMFDNPRPPRIFLCNTAKKILGELHTYDEKLTGKWNAYSELTFSIDRQYVDVLTGVTYTDTLFDKVEGLRNVYVENFGYFTIQDPDTSYADKDSKTVTAFSLEYVTSVKYLENFYINTGAEESKEVIYLSSIYGDGYSIDTPYVQVNQEFDAYESYYIKDYTDTDSYTYQQVSIANATVYATYDASTVAKTLYIKKYPNVRLYWPTQPELSLLHLIFAKIPEWNIGNVDATLWRKERKFEQDRIAVYDFLMNDISDTFKCVVEWDTIHSQVNFYEEAEDGITEEDTIQDRFETDVYISRDNLATEINLSYSTDDIKTKLKVSGSDNLDIREINLGKNYIMNLDYYHNLDWMEQDLFEAYDHYLLAINGNPSGATQNERDGYKKQYTQAMQGWVAAYNHWNELMNTVPAENDVLIIGDTFRQLYCLYAPIITAYLPNELTIDDIGTSSNIIYSDAECTQVISTTGLLNNTMFIIQDYAYYYNLSNHNFRCDRYLTPENLVALRQKLNLYHVDDDIYANKTDNILLRLKNADEDTAVIRIYDPKQIDTSNVYDVNAQYYIRNVGTNNSYSYTRISFSDATAYNTHLSNQGAASLYINDYKIQVIIIRATSGISEAPIEYSLTQWLQDDLTVDNELNQLEEFKISYIGTMGAYLCLAKDEVQSVIEANVLTHKPTEYLKSFGVNLLKTKQQTYTTLFQTQIENMFAQEKYQCVVSDIQPQGVYSNGTRWFDTMNNVLKVYNTATSSWEIDTYSVSSDDAKNYENYQRYIDNFYKLRAVQEVLNDKEKEAQYCLTGYPISSRQIDMSLYEPGSAYGRSLEEDLQTVAQTYFSGQLITHSSLNSELPLYAFTTSAYPSQTFAVYLNGKIPYVAYEASQGAYQAILNRLSQLSNLEEFLTDDQWLRLSPFIREDEYTNENFLLNSYESEEDRLKIYNELLEDAAKELKKLSQPSLDFSMNMGNILALPEFESILNQFELGKFIRIELRPGLVKRARLLQVNLEFPNLSSFSCDFGNLVSHRSEIDKHADLMKQAVQAGKQVATSANDWQKAVDKSNKLEESIANGLAEATLEIGRANGQSIELGQYGLRGRKLIDGTTDQYEDEQVALINNKLCFTADNWQTSKSAFGKFTIDGEEHWGVLSDAVVSGYIEGSVIKGGELEIGGTGGTFKVNPDGSVEILAGDGSSAYASSSDISTIQDARRFHTEIIYNGSTVFSEPNSSCILTCNIYSWDERIYPTGATYSWIRSSRANDITWNATHANQAINTITITNADIEGNAQFSCEVHFDDIGL